MQDNVEENELEEDGELGEEAKSTPPGQHQLEDIVRKMKRNAQEAMNILVKEMRKKDNDLNFRVSLAKYLMEYNTRIVDQVNKDSLNRSILELRQKDLALKQIPLKSVESEESVTNNSKLKSIDLVDFSKIKNIE